MTSIKPPSSGPTGPHTLPEISDAAGSASRADGTAPNSLQSSLDAPTSTTSASQVGASSADPIAQLAQAIETGAVTVDQAVDRLLGQTLQRAQKHLSGPQLDELSGLLRDALLNDPTLSAMRSDSER